MLTLGAQVVRVEVRSMRRGVEVGKRSQRGLARVGALAPGESRRQCGDLRFLHVSTDEVYGSLGSIGAFTETTSLDPHSPYSASKASSDHLVAAFHSTYGLPTIITRCSNNYGPYQFPEKMIPLMINNARND